MKKLIITAAVLAVTCTAYAGPAANQLGSALGVNTEETTVQAPSAPDMPVYENDEAETKGRCSDHHNNLPGCPGFCARNQEDPSCALPFHCRNNMQLHACRMHCVKYPKAKGCDSNKSGEEAVDEANLFDPELAKANCISNPKAPGCPQFCREHRMYPGCPQFCRVHPIHPACGKSVEAEVEEAETPVTQADEEEAKGRCSDHHNNLPGCPGYCAKHQEHGSCALPFHCRNNMQLYACKKHCDMYPMSQGCRKDAKAAEEQNFDEDLAKSNCFGNPNAPGCPGYCQDHHSYPGCPMFCQLNPLNPACGHVPAYCATNPNGYNCPKAAGTEKAADGMTEDELKTICTHHPNMHPSCALYCQTHPTAFGCKKSAGEDEAVESSDAKALETMSEDEAKSTCSHHHMHPGCPQYCQMNPLAAACGHVPAYCHTNPNGYNCPK